MSIKDAAEELRGHADLLQSLEDQLARLKREVAEFRDINSRLQGQLEVTERRREATEKKADELSEKQTRIDQVLRDSSELLIKLLHGIHGRGFEPKPEDMRRLELSVNGGQEAGPLPSLPPILKKMFHKDTETHHIPHNPD